jgi:hypothetical protein
MRPEAVLERHILRAIGAEPDVLLCKNEVGTGFRGALIGALREALAPFGREVVEVAMATLTRHRTTYGLGTGSPDLVGAAAGRWVGLELKSEKGRLREEQERWHAAARHRGAFVSVSRTVEEATAALARARKGETE